MSIRNRRACGIAAVAAMLALVAGSSLVMAQDKASKSDQTSGTQITNAYGGFLQDRSYSSPAEHLFVEKCSMCHRQTGMGTVLLARRMKPDVAMLEKRDDLTEDYIIQAARTGIGNMPRITRGEVSDAQLKAIAQYLAKGKK